jgi:toxin ParE1/3/4
MGIVTYLPDAIEDLHKIWAYVADNSQSVEVADRLIDAIDDVASTFAGQPHMGTPRPELAKNVRCFPVGNYVVFYFPITDGIEVIQVIHGARDIPTHFRR